MFIDKSIGKAMLKRFRTKFLKRLKYRSAYYLVIQKFSKELIFFIIQKKLTDAIASRTIMFSLFDNSGTARCYNFFLRKIFRFFPDLSFYFSGRKSVEFLTFPTSVEFNNDLSIESGLSIYFNRVFFLDKVFLTIYAKSHVWFLSRLVTAVFSNFLYLFFSFVLGLLNLLKKILVNVKYDLISLTLTMASLKK